MVQYGNGILVRNLVSSFWFGIIHTYWLLVAKITILSRDLSILIVAIGHNRKVNCRKGKTHFAVTNYVLRQCVLWTFNKYGFGNQLEARWLLHWIDTRPSAHWSSLAPFCAQIFGKWVDSDDYLSRTKNGRCETWWKYYGIFRLSNLGHVNVPLSVEGFLAFT